MTDFIYRGSIENLKYWKEDALVFTGKKSFEKIRPIVEEYLNFPFYYNDFSTNPKLEEIEKGVETISINPKTIIAIGGGSVIDFAKVYKYKTKLNVPLIAIPTTCGTGSEATQFAVYYKEGKKQSLDSPEVLPNVAIVDSQFVENNPTYLKACTALDAYCQAIESYFACKSTEKSRQYAMEAIKLCRDNLVKYVNSNEKTYSLNMSKASNLSGKAINISRTTKVMEYNKNVDEKSINDKRGVAFVRERMDEIYSTIGILNANDYFQDLFYKVGIEYKEYPSEYIDPERLKNNPRKIGGMNELH